MYLVQGLNRAATVNPSGLATVFRDRRRNWAESAARIFRLAGGLSALGIDKGDRVAILALNSDRYFEALFAVPAAGAAIVPINTRLAPPEIAFILEDSGAKALLVDDAFVPMIGRIPGLSLATQLIYIGDGPVPAGMRSFEALLDSDPVTDGVAGGDDLAGIFYTGGTTGRSKGVMLSHRNLVSNAAMVVPALGYGPDSVYLHAAPMFHLADGMSTFGLTMLGGTHAFVPRFDPAEVLAEIARNRVTHTVLVPTMINTLVNHPDVTNYDVSSLRAHSAWRLADPGSGGGKGEGGASRRASAPCLRHDRSRAAGHGDGRAARAKQRARPTVRPPSAARGCPHRRPGRQTRCRAAWLARLQVRGPNVMLGYWNQPEPPAPRCGTAGITPATAADGRRGFRLHRRSPQGHDHHRRRERLFGGGRERDRDARRCRRGGGHRHARRALGRSGARRRGPARRPHADGGADHRALPRSIAGYKCPRSVEIRTTSLPISGAGKVMKTQLREPFWAGRDRRVS